MKKISATDLEFAKPLTDGLAADAPLDLHRDTLAIAITLWSALVLQACGQGELLTELFDRFRKMPHRDTVIMGALVRDSIRRSPPEPPQGRAAVRAAGTRGRGSPSRSALA